MDIGGDIAGLNGVAGDLAGVAPQLTTVMTTLSKQVDSLVSAAGWNGNAADSFRGAWEQDGAASDELAQAVKLSATAIGKLADQLGSAQRQLDAAVASAKAAGLPITSTGLPAGTYSGAQLTAAQTFAAAVKAAQAAADTARQTAAATLDDILSAINPEMPGEATGTSIPELAGLGTILKGYYLVPAGQVEKIEKDIAKAKANYAAKHQQWKNSPAGSDARKSLSQELAAMRSERTTLSASLDDAENLADKFKGGKLLDTSVADVVKGLGTSLEDATRLSRLLDGIPVIDVAGAGLATWAQAKTDHEEGWSWTHAILADGGANAAGLAAGLATDAIPYVGPFLSPVVGYGVGAFVSEAVHNGHWTENIQQDGVVNGTMASLAEAGVATYNTDVVGTIKHIGTDIAHPGAAISQLWDGVKDLF
jgi:uncharacterized protein YukE